MPSFGPISRKNLVQNLKKMGFAGPYAGGKHEFMVRDELRLTLPNQHKGEIGKPLLTKILRQAAINRDEWEKL